MSHYHIVIMSVETQVATCTENYNMWKTKALSTSDVYQARKAVERAFFWMELRSAFLFLMTIEKTASSKEVKDKLIRAKLNLSKKLSDYLKEIIREMS
jgi:hypothetical protein